MSKVKHVLPVSKRFRKIFLDFCAFLCFNKNLCTGVVYLRFLYLRYQGALFIRFIRNHMFLVLKFQEIVNDN